MESVLLNNRYQLLELVGSGGMAAVYRGMDTLLQRQVAVKVLREGFASDPSFLARFQREARAAANLDHPNIVTVYDVGQDGIRHYIVMEYIDGQDLKTLIRRKGRLYVNETLDITVQVCAGVGHAHKAGLIHCDVKPQNVLITKDGRAKVTDFGIARALSESGITESSTVWGSPLYFSPEQATGDPPAPASDVYSIGIMMYEMLAGMPPFQAEKPAALALMHMREEPQPLSIQNPHVPSQLEWVVHKVLSKEPAARYRTAEQLGHVLQEYRRQSEQKTGWQPATPGTSPDTPIPASYTVEVEPSSVPRKAPNALTWALGAIAFVAVLGLIPLWSVVVRDYSARPTLSPTLAPTPLATFTPEIQLISVPNVLEKSKEEAQAMLARAGLRFVLQEEREEPDAEKGIVLEQDPAPETLVTYDTQVFVVVSRLGRELTMPDVVDYPVDIVQGGFESDGLQVILDPVWSTEPEGQILEQEPKVDTIVHAGDMVTLTVSGGVDTPIPLEANLANLAILESAGLRQETFPPGGMINVTLHWRALQAIDAPYVVFVHLISPDGSLASQRDMEPTPPTMEWVSDMEVADSRQVEIPDNLPSGLYQLRAGMYPQGQAHYRLPVVDAGSTTVELDSILVVEIEIKP